MRKKLPNKSKKDPVKDIGKAAKSQSRKKQDKTTNKNYKKHAVDEMNNVDVSVVQLKQMLEKAEDQAMMYTKVVQQKHHFIEAYLNEYQETEGSF